MTLNEAIALQVLEGVSKSKKSESKKVGAIFEKSIEGARDYVKKFLQALGGSYPLMESMGVFFVGRPSSSFKLTKLGDSATLEFLKPKPSIKVLGTDVTDIDSIVITPNLITIKLSNFVVPEIKIKINS